MADTTKDTEEDSDVEFEGMDMNDDDEAVLDEEELEDAPAMDAEETKDDDDVKVDEHEMEELEAARKERMDLMYVILLYLLVLTFVNPHLVYSLTHSLTLISLCCFS
jgi:hypothetical protein